jgi:hypothetical protein
MSRVPSVKATAFQSALDDLNRLVSCGKISRDDVERRLDPSDLPYLTKPLTPSSWVPLATSTRMLQLLFELEGGGDAESYMRERGRLSAERIHQMGLYRQFETAGADSVERAGRVAVTLSSVILNFTRWTFENGEDGCFRIVVDDAREMPEFNRLTGEGFIEHLVSTMPGARKMLVKSERVTPDRIVYRARPA